MSDIKVGDQTISQTSDIEVYNALEKLQKSHAYDKIFQDKTITASESNFLDIDGLNTFDCGDLKKINQTLTQKGVDALTPPEASALGRLFAAKFPKLTTNKTSYYFKGSSADIMSGKCSNSTGTPTPQVKVTTGTITVGAGSCIEIAGKKEGTCPPSSAPSATKGRATAPSLPPLPPPPKGCSETRIGKDNGDVEITKKCPGQPIKKSTPKGNLPKGCTEEVTTDSQGNVHNEAKCGDVTVGDGGIIDIGNSK